MSWNIPEQQQLSKPRNNALKYFIITTTLIFTATVTGGIYWLVYKPSYRPEQLTLLITAIPLLLLLVIWTCLLIGTLRYIAAMRHYYTDTAIQQDITQQWRKWAGRELTIYAASELFPEHSGVQERLADQPEISCAEQSLYLSSGDEKPSSLLIVYRELLIPLKRRLAIACRKNIISVDLIYNNMVGSWNDFSRAWQEIGLDPSRIEQRQVTNNRVDALFEHWYQSKDKLHFVIVTQYSATGLHGKIPSEGAMAWLIAGKAVDVAEGLTPQAVLTVPIISAEGELKKSLNQLVEYQAQVGKFKTVWFSRLPDERCGELLQYMHQCGIVGQNEEYQQIFLDMKLGHPGPLSYWLVQAAALRRAINHRQPQLIHADSPTGIISRLILPFK